MLIWQHFTRRWSTRPGIVAIDLFDCTEIRIVWIATPQTLGSRWSGTINGIVLDIGNRIIAGQQGCTHTTRIRIASYGAANAIAALVHHRREVANGAGRGLSNRKNDKYIDSMC